MKRIINAVFLSLMGEAALCATLTPGEWCDAFVSAKSYAEENHIPLVLVVGNETTTFGKCEHCRHLEAELKDPTVVAWMRDRQYVFCKVWVKDGKEESKSKGAKEFAKYTDDKPHKDKGLVYFPFVGLYWPKADGMAIRKNFSGWDEESGNISAAEFMKQVDSVLCAYGNAPYFEVGNTVGDRLEATPGVTTEVAVPVARSATSSDLSFKLRATFPHGGGVSEQTVSIPKGKDRPATMPVVRIPTGIPFAAGEVIELKLVTADADPVAGSITFVKRENSPKNPTWKGVTDFGEWTMDLAAARQKIIDYKSAYPGAKAYTLALVAGGMWCPDCAKTDAYLIDTPAFRQWAASNNVACAVVDIPNWSATAETGPCLLTREAQSVSDTYIAADPEKGPKQSGAGYLSRWMIDDIAAGLQLEDNRKLIARNTLNGGWNRPERSNQYRTGVPIFILLNDDGTIAGRLEKFASTSPTSTDSVPTNIDRLNDLLASAGRDESDVHWMTAGDHVLTLGGETGVSQLSAIDLSDYWRVGGVTGWVRGTFRVKSETSDAGATADVALNLIRLNAGKEEKIASATGCLRNGVTLGNVELAAANEYFLQVQALEDSDTFSFARKGPSVVAYALTSQGSPDAGAVRFSETGMTVKEADLEKAGGTLELNVPLQRQGGASGPLIAAVTVDAEGTTAYDDQYELLDGQVEWTDGDRSARSVRLLLKDDFNADGQRIVVLACGETRYTVTLIDNDKTNTGKLAIDSADPAPAKKDRIIATEGRVIRIGVTRLDGASGDVSARLSVSGGEWIGSNQVSWKSRESGTRWCELRLPRLADVSKDTLSVSLSDLKGIKAKTSKLKIELVAENVPAFEEPEIADRIFKSVVYERRVAIQNLTPGSAAQVKKVSGSMPSGLKVSVEGGFFVIAGAPSAKKTSYEAVYRVSEKSGKRVRAGLTIRLRFSLTDGSKLKPGEAGYNPILVKSRTFTDLMVLDSETSRLAGLLTVTLPTTGKASAKYRCADGTVSFKKSAGWESYDAESGVLSLDLSDAKKTCRLVVTIDGNGRMEGRLVKSGFEADGVFVTGEEWNQSRDADGVKGLYTVDFAFPESIGPDAPAAIGDAVATLKMSGSSSLKKGKMTYAGTLSNGKSFSGSSILTLDGQDAVIVPLCTRSSADFFTAAPRILRGRPRKAVGDTPSVVPLWRHTESVRSYALSYTQTAGSAYDSDLDFKALAMEMQGRTDRVLGFGDAGLEPMKVEIKSTKPVLDSQAGNPHRVKLSFKRSTGVVSGSFRIEDSSGKSVKAKFKGVVLPDWDECVECNDGRPWAAGSFWLPDASGSVFMIGKP